MSLVERLAAQAKESKRRRDAAIDAVMALPPEERQVVLGELLVRMETEAERSPKPQSAGGRGDGLTFVQKAEDYVLANPKGVKTADVGRAIGQDVSSVDGSLRQALKRGRIARENGLWVPAQPNASPELKRTIRDLITEVFANSGNEAIGAAALFEALKGLEPEINRSSVDGEMARMRKANILIQVGVGPNAGGLYRLAMEAPTAG